MNLKVIRSDAHRQPSVSIICLFLLGASFLVGLPGLFSSSLPSSSASAAAQLSISVAPSLILASPGFHAILSVQLLDINTQNPIDSHGATVQVVLTSNATNVASMTTLLYIPPGRSYAIENLTAGGSAGVANITASAQGYLPSSFVVTARQNVTNSATKGLIVPYFAPGKISNDNYTYPNMVVGELQTIQNGISYPALAPNAGVEVYGRSSDNSTMQVSSSPYTIPQGGVYATFNLTSTFFPGNANITMQANNWNSTTTLFTSFGTESASSSSTPTFSVQNTVSPTRVLPGQKFNVTVEAQTLGAPVSSAGASLNWTSNVANVSMADSALNATGYGSAAFVASQQNGAENIQVLISKGGIQSYLDNITVEVYLNNFSVSVINPHPAITTGYSTSLGLHVMFNDSGVANATISWSAPNGTLTTPPLKTNGTGYAFVTYVSGSVAGNQSVIATISKTGFANMTERVYYSVVHATAPPPVQKQLNSNPLLIKVGNVLPVWVFIPIAGAAGGVGFFFFRRYRNGGGYSYDE